MTVSTPNTAPIFSAGRTGYRTVTENAGWSVNNITAMADGRLLTVVGYGLSVRNADGTANTTFNGYGSVPINLNPDGASFFHMMYGATILPNGKILVAGSERGNGYTQYYNTGVSLVELNANGSLDTSFGNGKGAVLTNLDPTSMVTVIGTTVLANGRILVATDVTKLDTSGTSTLNIHHIGLVRYLANGTLDTTFASQGKMIDVDPTLRATGMTVQADGKILVSAYTSYDYSVPAQMVIARFNADGSRDLGFGLNGVVQPPFSTALYDTSKASGITLQAEGKFLVIGQATIPGTNSHFTGSVVMRYNSDGTLDTSFASGGVFNHLYLPATSTPDYAGSSVRFVHVNDDGSILISGFTAVLSIFGEQSIFTTRLRADGSIDTTFGVNGLVTTNLGVTFYSTLDGMTVTTDGHIILAASVVKQNPGSPLPILIEYTVNGAVASDFGDVLSSVVNSTSVYQGYPDQFLDSSITVADAQLAAFSGYYTGASVTLTRDGGAVASDLFSGGGALSFHDGKAFVNGVDIGTVVNGSGTLRIVFNDHASQVLLNTALQSIAYQNNSTSIDEQHVRINWTFNDGNVGAQGSGGALAAQFATDVTLHTVDTPYWIDALLHRNDPGQTATDLRTQLNAALGNGAGLSLAFANDAGAAAYSSADRAFIQKLVDGLSAAINLPAVAGGTALTVHNTAQLPSGEGASTPIGTSGGNIYFSFGSAGSAANASGNSITLLHELEQALGLTHPADLATGGGGLPAADDHSNFTVLSSGTAAGTVTGAPGVLDIAALQYLYGPNPAARVGNDTYQISASASNFIWDGAGNDTISAAGLTANLSLHLSPGYWDYIGSKGISITAAGQITVNYGSVIENATGGTGNDTMTGTDAANTLRGGAGNDILTGLGGNDLLDGGDGLDTAVYSGQRASYVITPTSNGYLVTSLVDGEGSDTLSGIERVQFSDVTVKFNSLPTGKLTVVGAAANHQLLSVLNSLADADGMGTPSYQWYRDGSAVANATAATYQLSKADVGGAMSVTARYVDAEGTAESVTSAATVAVAASNALAAGSVVFDGTAVQGQSLSIVDTLSDLDGLGKLSYQWYADGQLLAGANGSALSLTEAQVGKKISASVSYIDGAGNAESVSTAASTAVTNVNDQPQGSVVISGKAVVGQMLSVSASLTDIDGMGNVSYQWYADAVSIDGQHGESLALTTAQAGKVITVKASYIDGHGTAEMVSSLATAVVNTPGVLVATGHVGTGEMLSIAIQDQDGISQASYRWQLRADDGSWSAIPGVTASALALSGAQSTQQVRVDVTYTDTLGVQELHSATWAPSAASRLSGSSAYDVLTGGSGNDVLAGLGGNDTLDGAAGLDTASFSGQRSSYLIKALDGGYVVTSLLDGAVATLANIERIQFSDTTVNFNTTPTGHVSIAGYAANHQTLTAVSTLADLDGLGVLSYQWYRGGSAVAGADGAAYQLGLADVGKAMSVTVRYVDGIGTAESASSTASAVVAAANSPATGGLTIKGVAVQGGTLSLANTVADLDGLGTVKYQWYADSAAIAGTNASVLLLTEVLVGKVISASMAYIDGAGYSETINSVPMQAVVNVNDRPAGDVLISGKAIYGQVLSVSNTLIDADGLGQISYQWYADSSAIEGQHGGNLSLTAALLGKAITVRASYIDGHGTSEAISSLATTPVIHINTPGVLKLSGTVAQGETLNAGASDLDGIGDISYLWQAGNGDSNWSTIEGASGAALLVSDALAGQRIRVDVSYTDAMGAREQMAGIWAAAASARLTGTQGNDVLTGGNGNDILSGGAGNDALDGGAGINTAAYAGKSGDYTVLKSATGMVITDGTGGDGVDTLSNIQRLHFNDKDMAFDIDGTGGQAYRLYQAAFNRAPDASGLGYWIAMLDKGVSMQSVAAGFIGSQEFQSLYGAQSSNRIIVNGLYENVLHRTPDAGGLDYWAGVLDSHAGTLDQILSAFSESPENQQTLAQVIGKGIAYLPYGG